jgi:hypothetical protein
MKRMRPLSARIGVFFDPYNSKNLFGGLYGTTVTRINGYDVG